jgi:succinate dehydrogenase flavin-adding protein (antitoxin of CptAB toxin-antitoxin module)
MVEISITPEESYPVHEISHETAEHLYQFSRLFWKDRLGQELTDSILENVLEDYRKSYLKPQLGAFRHIIAE